MEADKKESISSVESSKSDPTAEVKEEAKNIDEQTRLWAAVKEKPSDFTSWTRLLQLVEQKGNLAAAREVFDTFFKFYPYCYGYWKKFADLEKTNAGNESAKQVYERGVVAVSLSVDMWMNYIKFATSKTTESEDIEAIRSLYERALSACGLEYRSSKLWDSYLTWEKANGSPAQMLAIYDRLLATPTQQLQQHFENFKKFMEERCSAEVLSNKEYSELCTEVGSLGEGELEKAVKEKAVERRIAVFERTQEEVAKRVKFEEAIKRPYFHVKPLEKNQLKTWRDYLDFELSEGDSNRIVVLFERCMIACALYEEFWSKFAGYAEDHSPELARSVYTRACTIHLQQKPDIHVSWAAFEEKNGNVDKAREILTNISSVAPGFVSVRLARVGLEFRRRHYLEVETLYHSFLADPALTGEARNFYSWRYAKFAARVLGDHSKATQIVRDALSKDPSNSVLYLQLLDLETSRTPPSESAVEAIFEEIQANSEVNDVTKVMFAQRRVTFLEEFGSDIDKLVNARLLLDRLKSQAGKKRTNIDDSSEGEPSKRAKLDSAAGATSTAGSGQPAGTAASTAVTMATTIAPPTAAAAMSTPTDPQQQQWAAYQQQWGAAYAYGQPGYNYGQYYSQYPQSYTHQTSTQ